MKRKLLVMCALVAFGVLVKKIGPENAIKVGAVSIPIGVVYRLVRIVSIVVTGPGGNTWTKEIIEEVF